MPPENFSGSAAALLVATRAAQKAGEIIKRGWDRTQVIEEKGFGDLVSRIDVECDRIIQEHLRAAYPEDAILSEEISPGMSELPRRFWIVDPLDGTSAFLFRVAPDMPSVMIALWENGEARLSVVYFPLTGELFSAVRGEGAYKGRQRLRCRSSKLHESWVEMNQYSDVQFESLHFRTLRENLRKPGGAMLVTTNAAYSGAAAQIAEGKKRLSAVIHDNGPSKLKQGPWDVVAPALILTEAGGVAVNLRGSTYDPFMPEPFIMASSRHLAREIINLL